MIYHDKGLKKPMVVIRGARMSNTGSCFLAVQSEVSERRGIVEISAEEMAHILAAKSKLNSNTEEQILRTLG